jgi:multidrug resistance protein MdtO
MLIAPNLSARRSLALQSQTEIGHLKTDLDLIKYEPPRIRPARKWLTRRRRALQEISALEAPLFLSAGRDVRFSADLATRLNRLADGLDPARPSRAESADRKASEVQASGDGFEPGSANFQHLIEPHFQSLEHVLTQQPDSERTLSDAPA